MYEKNKNVVKMNGGGVHYYRFSQILRTFLIMLFFVINVFAEIPHSYVTENPDKEVTQTETLKRYKEKAELNLSITKIKSKEVEGLHNPEQKKIYFSLDNIEYEIQPGDKIYLSEELQEVPSISTTNGRRKINGMLNQKILKEGSLEYTVTNERTTSEIEVKYSKTPKQVYIGILDKQYQIKKILKGNIKKIDINLFAFSDSLGMLYNKNYDQLGWGAETHWFFTETIFESKSKYGKNTFVKKVSGTNRIQVGHTQERPGYFWIIVQGYDKNGNLLYKSPKLGELSSYSAAPFQWASKDWSITLPDNYIIVIKTDGNTGDPYHDNSNGNNTIDVGQVFNVKLDDFIHKADGVSNLIVDENYEPEYIKFDSCTIDTIKPLSLLNSPKGVKLASTSGDGILHLDPTDTLEINGQKHTLTSSNLDEQKLELNKVTLSYKVENGKLQLRVDKYGLKVPSPQPITIKIVKDKEISDVMNHTINLTVPYVEKIIGESVLEVKEYYPSPEYIAFNSCNINSPKDIALENNLRDVKLTQTSGKGLVGLEQSDILEINGKKYTIGAGGNLPEQSDTLGNINFKFKVEVGKIRLALTSWGVLEPDRVLTINAKKNTNVELMEHRMTIKAPRRVEGTSTLKFTEKYPIRDIVRFQGISLTAPNIGGIEPPIPAGVSYKSNDGYGIPFMKEGDILEVQCETMRATQKYIIDSKNSLKHQTIDLPGTVLSLLVEDGKLRLGLNNWLVNKNTVLNFRVIRGVNEISNTSITLEVPKAPFDILKNGILDFGKLIQGSKNKKAETSILLEMHQDISNVRYSLSTTTPELVNSSGATLHARDLQAGVQKQGNKRHLVRIIGRLDVPEKQELGVYRGSVLLNVTIK